VEQDPDKWLTMRTVSAGGGHGPILLGKLEAWRGSLRRPRDHLIPTSIYREISLLTEIYFYIGKNLRFWLKSANDLESVVFEICRLLC